MAIYAVWWKKPYQVTEPVPVYGELPEPNSMQKRVNRRIADPVVFKAVAYSVGLQDMITDLRSLKGIPAFYSGAADGSTAGLSLVLYFIVGSLFGTVHFLGWSSSFPTRTSQLLWRISAIGITGAPISGVVILLISDELENASVNAFMLCLILVVPPLFVFYLFGRVVTFVLASMTLRTPLPSVYRTLEWSDLLPHI